MSPSKAVAWAAFFNFTALFIFHQGVAKTVSSLVKVNAADPAFVWVVLAGLIGAVFWNLLTWFLALPSSSSHAIMGGFSGAGFAYGGADVLNTGKLLVTAEFIVIAPALGLVLGSVLYVIVAWSLRRVRPQHVNRMFRGIRMASAAAYSIGHGGNDAQKTMGIILAVLIAGGYMPADATVGPTWVAVACYSAMALGTAMGGWRIIKTLGTRLTKLSSHGAFCAELSGAMTLFGATWLGIPVSTTHTITGAIVGVGAARRVSAVRWNVASNIVVAWVVTMPAAGLIAW